MQAVVASSTRISLDWLCKNGFIGWNGASSSYAALPMGKATSAGSLKPLQALIVRKVSVRLAQHLRVSISGRGLVTIDTTKLDWLCKNGFSSWNGASNPYAALPLGQATSAGSLKPLQALIVMKVSVGLAHHARVSI